MDEYIRIGVTIMSIGMLAVAVMLPVVIIVVVVQFTRLLRSPGGPEFLASLSTPEGAANLSRMWEVERRQQEQIRQQEMFDHNRQHGRTAIRSHRPASQLT